jgi:hypothetical protein
MGDVYASEKYLPPSSLASAVPAVVLVGYRFARWPCLHVVDSSAVLA